MAQSLIPILEGLKIEKKLKDLSNIVKLLEDKLRQLDEKGSETIKSGISKDQLQDLLSGTLGLLNQLNPNDQQTLGTLMQMILDPRGENRKP